MKELTDLFQSADWKKEKHVPVIECPEKVKKGEFFNVSIEVGKEIPHPNKTEHHIRWITLYFLPDDSKFPYEMAKLDFNSHGESTNGPDTSTVYTHPKGMAVFKTDKPGTIIASSYCNIHGLWKSSKKIEVE